MSYLGRVFENASEAVTIPNPLTFSGAVAFTGALNLAGATVTGMTLTGSVVAPDTDDGAALGSTSLKWSDLFLASGAVINFNSGNALITHSAGLLTFSAGNVAFGVDATGIDVTFYGDTTAYKVWWDQNGDTNGAWYFGADTKGVLVSAYGAVTGCGVFWNPDGDTNGVLSVGASGGSKGNDFLAYGATNGNYMHWDQSANSLLLVGTSSVLNIAGTTASTTSATGALICAGGVGIGGATFLGNTLTVGVNDTGYDVKFFGDTASCYALYDASEDQLAIVQTNAATTGVERSLTVSQTHTGIGASAEVAAFTLTTNTIGGSYQNALFAKLDYGTTGGVTGLAGVICAELTMPGGAIAGEVGTYAVFEAEINCPTSYAAGVPLVVFSINAWGAAVAKFDECGYLFDLTGVSSGAGSIWYDNQKAAPAVEEFVRVKTPAGVRYLGLYNANA